MKKIACVILMVIITMNLGMTSFANNDENKRVNYNLIEGVVGTRDETIPITTWNVVTDGEYFYDGSSSSQPLYTLYIFTGTSDYVISVYNRLSTSVSVNVVSLSGSNISNFTVSGNSAVIKYISTTKNFYLRFSRNYVPGLGGSPVDVHGMVCENIAA